MKIIIIEFYLTAGSYFVRKHSFVTALKLQWYIFRAHNILTKYNNNKCCVFSLFHQKLKQINTTNLYFEVILIIAKTF